MAKTEVVKHFFERLFRVNLNSFKFQMKLNFPPSSFKKHFCLLFLDLVKIHILLLILRH